MSTISDESPAEFSGLTVAESSVNDNKLMNVLQNLTSTLSRLSQVSEAQTAALADLEEDLLLQDDTPDEEQNIDKQPDSGDITAVVNNCTHDSSKKNVVFLVSLHDKGLSYTTISTARSAVSAICCTSEQYDHWHSSTHYQGHGRCILGFPANFSLPVNLGCATCFDLYFLSQTP